MNLFTRTTDSDFKRPSVIYSPVRTYPLPTLYAMLKDNCISVWYNLDHASARYGLFIFPA